MHKKSQFRVQMFQYMHKKLRFLVHNLTSSENDSWLEVICS
jgi:hypothetical protein